MQKFIALVLIGMLSAPTGVFAQPPSSQAVAEEDLWATLQGLTPGTSLQLTLANGQNATGNVVEVRPDAIVISGGFSADPSRVLTRLPDGTVLFLGSAVTRVRVGRVPSVRPMGSLERQPADVATVGQLVKALGVGKKVEVTTTRSKKLRARIQSVDEASFTVTHGRTAVPLTIAYEEVTQLRAAGWPLRAKVGLAVGVYIPTMILLTFVCAYGCAGF